MKEALLKFFEPREERVAMAGETYFVRTRPNDSDPIKGGDDAIYQFTVRCTFDADGKLAFTDDDIPTLKAAPDVLKARLQRAVALVNGFDLAEEEKNSGAGPSSG